MTKNHAKENKMNSKIGKQIEEKALGTRQKQQRIFVEMLKSEMPCIGLVFNFRIKGLQNWIFFRIKWGRLQLQIKSKSNQN
jgi:hypothetical protein